MSQNLDYESKFGEMELTVVYSRGAQKTKKLDFNRVEWFFPLHRMPGVTTKNFRPLDQLEDPALSMPNYTKEYSENTKEISESQ